LSQKLDFFDKTLLFFTGKVATMKKLLKSISPIIVLIILILIGVYKSRYRSNPFEKYQDPKLMSKGQHLINFKFEEVGESLGVTHIHEVFETHPERTRVKEFANVPASVAIGDFNNDGWQDLFFTQPKQGKPNTLYINLKGKGFKDVTAEWGLNSDLQHPSVPTSALFVDYDNDGWIDIYIGSYGCHKLYKNIKGSSFKDVSVETGISKICHHTTSLNIIDYDKDGWLDIYVGNFKKLPGLQDIRKESLLIGKSGHNRNGGSNFLLKNLNGKKFKNVASELGVADTGLTWAIGINDFNGDSWPDIYLANDFGEDRLFINQKGKRFKDVTQKSLGLQRGRASMSASVGDYDNDGRPDLYVSNISEVGFTRGLNALYRQKKNGTFANKSAFAKVDKCGFGWGTKFFDPNRDGKLDLAAVNGYWNKGDSDYWFKYMTISSLPPYLKRDPNVRPLTEGTSLGGSQRSCLFLSDGKRFYDVAPLVGLSDRELGRGIAVLDIENDGDQDLVITNVENRPFIYKTVSLNEFRWVGFQLKGAKKNLLGVGAKVQLISDGSRFHQQANFANGFNSQSESRLFFGLGERSQLVDIIIEWPSGKVQNLRNLETNKYHTLKEPK
jgi:hypothetical protein